jgi:hypothetical protein
MPFSFLSTGWLALSDGFFLLYIYILPGGAVRFLFYISCQVGQCWTEISALFALSATSQQYFSLATKVISKQSAVLFSQNKPAPAISHQPNEQADMTRCLL